MTGKKLFVSKLMLDGPEYRRTLAFDKGLNVISGEATSGKSLVLKLIDYCLGKSSKFDFSVQKELGQYCESVFLEIYIDEQVLTLKRNLKSNHTKIEIYYSSVNDLENYIPKVVLVKDLTEFLFGSLNIPMINRVKNKPRSNDKTVEKFSIRDVMRFVYMRQEHIGTSNFLENNDKDKRYKNSPTFELLFNFLDADLVQINEQIAKKTNEIEQKKRERGGLEQYLQERDAILRVEVTDQIEEIKGIIEQVNAQKKELLTSKYKQKEVSNTYGEINQQLMMLEDEKSQLNQKKKELLFSKSSHAILLERYKKEKESYCATQEVLYKLEISSHEKVCPLCNSHVQCDDVEEIHPQDISTLIKEIESKEKTANEIIERIDEQLSILENQVVELDERVRYFKRVKSSYSQNINIPLLEEIEALNKMILEHENRLSFYKELERVHKKIDEKERDIAKLEGDLEKLEEQKSNIKVEIEYKDQILKDLNQKYIKLLKKFHYHVDESTDYISSLTFMPHYQDVEVFKHESGGLLLCIQLAYIGSILENKLVNEDNKHPGFLMLDSISNNLGTNKDAKKVDNLDPESYEAIYKLLLSLAKDFQIFVVDNTPPEFIKPKFTFYRHNREGLINPKCNEKNIE
ncbi:AAA family ATPase [Bacillus mobilis]|uniref:AAA family ATPase n=1 Tax=Bacillus mobilis TaxID=2026190 RepID=UPI0022E47744|nr:AAA family ATPase [Bacillus mobilis]